MSRRISSEYYVPHLSHAQMEPVVSIARVQNGTVEVWAPTQSPQDARGTLAEYLKMDIEKITVHVNYAQDIKGDPVVDCNIDIKKTAQER